MTDRMASAAGEPASDARSVQAAGSPEPAPAAIAAPLDEPINSLWAPSIVGIALIAAIGTFLFLMGTFGIEPAQNAVLVFLGVDVVLILALLVIVIRQLIRLRRANLAGLAGARLHRRIVGLFSLVAAVPTTLVAGAGLLALERGLTPWFSGDLRALVQNADVISQNFQQQICQNLGREMRLMANDLDRANASGFFLGNTAGFQTFLNGRAAALGFPHAVIFKEDGSLVEKAQVEGRQVQPPTVSPEDFRYAATEEPPCLFSRESIGGLIQLKNFGTDSFLMVARGIDPRMLEFPVIARSGVVQYQVLEARRQATQFGIALVFALLTLIGLLASVLLGLGFADRLVDPIRRLMQATDQVSAGNLYVQVPLAKIGSDLSQLGATFNNMTTVLREQHNSLSEANALIDQRRRFMEAVLSGVPAGVIGLDAEGHVSLVNPMARLILALGEQDVHDRPYAELFPEIADAIEEARGGSQRLSQHEIIVRRRGVERILSVRVTGDSAGGHVVTLDDITDLVTAQRTSAWADVARRIAHEIKNPLTPIQLSAERIRRKFGKVIVEDRPVFDQCTDTIIRQVEDIKRMVDEFSSFARMPKPQPADEDIVTTLREVAFMMRVGNPGVEIVETLPETPVLARFDRRLVSQAVQNLIKNACEAIAESPSGAAGTGRIEISLPTQAGSEVLVDILDNGKGFPKEGRQRLLEPYMTTREGGTGLGLPIVAKIFEDHGGRIELLDPPAKNGTPTPGALVRVHLPCASAQPGATATPQTLTPSDTRPNEGDR
ncbi:MAG: two-component system NtrC family nitrogen regulation sensor histidine kinase [Beijerinckiaceae bacterium]|nr:MAG: two-component system NtrC family nitrogen regulation sensor histidine kinase [Beijerinckiaceae bacterium]